LALNCFGVVETSVIGFLSALVSAAIVKDPSSQIALVSDNDGVSTQVLAFFDGRNVIVKWRDTTQAIIRIEASFTW
jgi:hypothetical protein